MYGAQWCCQQRATRNLLSGDIQRFCAVHTATSLQGYQTQHPCCPPLSPHVSVLVQAQQKDALREHIGQKGGTWKHHFANWQMGHTLWYDQCVNDNKFSSSHQVCPLEDFHLLSPNVGDTTLHRLLWCCLLWILHQIRLRKGHLWGITASTKDTLVNTLFANWRIGYPKWTTSLQVHIKCGLCTFPSSSVQMLVTFSYTVFLQH